MMGCRDNAALTCALALAAAASVAGAAATATDGATATATVTDGAAMRLRQARALAASARFEDAVVVLDAYLEETPEGRGAFEALILRGEALVASSATTKRFQEAAVSFSMAVECDGISRDDVALATLRLADVLLRMGDADGAEAAVMRLDDASRATFAHLAREERNPRILNGAN